MTTGNAVDVAVIGGGPAGAVAALTLAKAGLRTVLLESGHYSHPQPGQTLSPPGRSLLERLGITNIDSVTIPSYGIRSSWGSPALDEHAFVFDPYGAAHHLDRPAFDARLAAAAEEQGVGLSTDTAVTACNQDARGSWRLTLRGPDRPRQLEARAICDTTGRPSRIARSLGAKRLVADHLIAIRATYELRDGELASTMIESAPQGWWYSAPTRGNQLAVFLFTDADICRRERYTDPRAWSAALADTKHTHRRTEQIAPVSGPHLASAASHRLDRRGTPDMWIAAGDSALAVDPLSGSGILRALLMGEAAAHALTHSLNGRSEPAQQYETWLDNRYADYLEERVSYYQLEQRWSYEPFWQRRNEARLPLSAAN